MDNICCEVCVKLSNEHSGAVDEMEKVHISAKVARILKSKSRTRSVLSWTGPQNHTTKKHIFQFFVFVPKQDLIWAVSILHNVTNTINTFFEKWSWRWSTVLVSILALATPSWHHVLVYYWSWEDLFLLKPAQAVLKSVQVSHKANNISSVWWKYCSWSR